MRLNVRLALTASLCLNFALLPLAASPHLRWQYQQTLAIWLAKVRSPKYVFVGDSITAGGRMFGRIDTINLGANGLTTAHIAKTIEKAGSYDPHRIVVMSGTNDALMGKVDPAELSIEWRKIVSDHRVIVTLAPPTTFPTANAQIERVNAIARREAERAGRRVLILSELAGPGGRLRPQFSADGVHLTSDAYDYWHDRL